MVLLGIVPVLTHAPPTISRCSITATRRPLFAACMAARWPAGPEPITMRSNVCMPRLHASGVEPFFHFLPVDHIPPRGHVIRAAVLVFQVIGMLPNVAAHYRELALHNRAVLVGSGDHLDSVGRFHQPGPTGAEARGARLVELFLERVEPAEGARDRLRHIACRRS